LPESERHLVLFSLHGEHYAVPVASVREIIRYVAPGATATARGLIRGMINLRGRVVPIVDLSSRLGRSLEVDSSTRILVLELSRGTLGLIVDTVDGVVLVPEVQIEALPVAVADTGLGVEIAAVGERLILLIDLERALGELLPEPPPPPKPVRRRRKTTPE
jgi:purine-binding chemotaxis protein CheW